MVRVDTVRKKNGNKIVANLIADTKEEVVSGLKLGDDEVDFGSIAITVSGEVAILDSDGEWNWIGEEE